MTDVAGRTERYVADFAAFARNGASGAPEWLRQIREGAIARFAELGFPTTKQEEWRFTSVAPIAETRFSHPASRIPHPVLSQIESLLIGTRPRLVLIDGRYAPEPSSDAGQAGGGRRPDRVTSPQPVRDRARGGSRGGRDVRRARRRCVLEQRGQRDRGGPRRARRAVPRPAGRPSGPPGRNDTFATGTRQLPGSARRDARRRAGPSRHHRRPGRRGCRARAQRVVPVERRPARRPPHGDRPRPAALREPRVLQRRAGGAGARRVQRTHHRAAGGAAHRFQADQQQPAAVGRSARRQPAPARDLRRRREVHPWLHGGADRPDSAVLSPQPRAVHRGGPRHPHLRIRRRDPGPPRAAGGAGPERPAGAGAARVMLDAARLRADFPLLAQRENGHPLVYLDNAATTQKPQAVLDAITEYYRTTNANVHRGAYDLAIRATEAYEAARTRVAGFVNAWAPEGVVFTRGTTEAINLVAAAYGRAHVRTGDSVVVTAMEHHSNLVPWQMLCQEKGATLRMVEITGDGRIDLSDYGRALERRPRIVAFPYVSNALGTVNPAAQLARLAHAVGAVVVVDGAQSTPHLKVDVQTLDCDFYALSG